MKPGVNLPKSQEDWNLANMFFIANVSCADVKEKDLDSTVNEFNTTVYKYFKTNFVIVKTCVEQELIEKYSNFTKTQLRTELKHLKTQNTNSNAIRYLSEL